MKNADLKELMGIISEMLIKIGSTDKFLVGVERDTNTIIVVSKDDRSKVPINDLIFTVSEAIKVADVPSKEYFSKRTN